MGRLTRSKKIDANDAAIIERQKQALELRKAGASYRRIGDQLGISHEQARRDIEGALALHREDVASSADGLRALEVARLDDTLYKLQLYLNGEPQYDAAGKFLNTKRFAPATVMAAIDRTLKVMERRAKLLGLDKPIKVEHSGDNDNPILIALTKMDVDDL